MRPAFDFSQDLEGLGNLDHFRLVRAQHAHVIRPLKRSGLRHGALAHAAVHLFDGLVLVFFHPDGEIPQYLPQVINSVLQDG